MAQGVWILAFMIYTGRHETALIPYRYYDSQLICETIKASESLRLNKPLVCVQEVES